METNKWGALAVAGALLVTYNLAQPGLAAMRNNETIYTGTTNTREAYGPSMVWLDRLAMASRGQDQTRVKLDFSVLSSLMVAGLAANMKSQVANLLWMKSDEYWHQGLFTRQVPLMEAVVTLDPEFIDAWSTAGWHWAYNIYADIPLNPDYQARGGAVIQAAQEDAIATGLDYLHRGSNMNPDTYRLWFEHGWTRAEKAGYYDDETLDLYKLARTKSDAREIEVLGPDGQPRKEQGMDILGRTIGHLLERRPQFDAALDHYAGELMGLAPDSRDRRMLEAAGQYWRRYSTDYFVIGQLYQSGDEVTRAQIRQLVPDVERLIEAHETRQRLASVPGKDQNVGAFITIEARYMPAWRLWQSGDIDAAVEHAIGAMNADPRYHLTDLDTLERIYRLRGDSAATIAANIERVRDAEIDSAQGLGIHFLAKLYEAEADKYAGQGNQQRSLAFRRLAYETWYRARERNKLNFYALRNTRLLEQQYGFETPEHIVREVKEARQGGAPRAAPASPPNVQRYYRN